MPLKIVLLNSMIILLIGCGSDKASQNQHLSCIPAKDVVMGLCNDPTKRAIPDNCSAELWNTKNDWNNIYEPSYQYRGFCR